MGFNALDPLLPWNSINEYFWLEVAECSWLKFISRIYWHKSEISRKDWWSGASNFIGFALRVKCVIYRKNVLEENDSALAVNGYVLLIRSTLIVYGL